MSTKKTGCEFLDTELLELNKTVDEVVTEKVTKFLKIAIIECKSQISTRKIFEIEKKKLELETAEHALESANEEVEKLKVKVPTDGLFQTYMDNLYNAELKADKAMSNSEKIKSQISNFEKEVTKFETTLTRLESNLAKLKK